MTAPWPPEVTLESARVRLEPLSMRHSTSLADAVRDGELWKLWFTTVPAPAEMEHEIERRLVLREAGSMSPFTVVRTTDEKPVGMTTFMNIDAPNRRVEIGSTWYRASVQRTSINTECKRMLLAHAFETLDCIAVEFRTHRFNRRSRAAIERLGAKLDGVLRNHQIDRRGLLRDTCVYSIIAAEWPVVRAHLDFRLAAGAPSSPLGRGTA